MKDHSWVDSLQSACFHVSEVFYGHNISFIDKCVTPVNIFISGSRKKSCLSVEKTTWCSSSWGSCFSGTSQPQTRNQRARKRLECNCCLQLMRLFKFKEVLEDWPENSRCCASIHTIECISHNKINKIKRTIWLVKFDSLWEYKA